MKSRRLGLALAVLSFLVPLLVYGLTLCPTVSFLDGGELCVAASKLCVPHPTGYPIYVLLGRLFSLFAPGSPIVATNFLSAFFAAASGLFLYLAIVKVLSIAERDERKVLLLAFFSAGASSFSLTIWTQAVATEVYSLTAFFASVLFYLSFSDNPRAPFVLAYSFGLALGNHMSIVMVGVPCVIYLVAMRRVNLKMIPLLAVLFLAGISVYAYIPLRAGQSPIVNWGNADTLERFIRHVTGSQYSGKLFSSLAAFRRNFGYFVRLLLGQYTAFLIWLPFLGLVVSVRKVAVRLLAAVFVLNVFYAVNYNIPDIDAHYTPAFIAAAFFIAFGLQFLFKKKVRRPLLLLGAAVMVIPLAFNYHICDMSRNRIAYEYGENHLKSIDSGGLCFSNTWDLYSVILYMRHVEGKRRDVVMINKGLLRASWYFDYLKKEYPATYSGSEREIKSYLEELTKLERRTGGDPREMQRRFIVTGNSLLDNHMKSGPIYTTFVNGQGMDTPEIGKRFRKIPHGIVFEFTEDGQAAPFDWSSLELSSSFGMRIHKDQRMLSDLAHYPIMMFLSGTALMEAGMYADAKTAFENTLAIEPQNLYARLHLGRAELMLGHYQEAIWAFEAVLQRDPRNELALQGFRTARSELGME